MGSGGGANRASFPAGEVDPEAASCRGYGGRRQRRTKPTRRRWRGRHRCKRFFYLYICQLLKDDRNFTAIHDDIAEENSSY
jgi:hypothetical protein